MFLKRRIAALLIDGIIIISLNSILWMLFDFIYDLRVYFPITISTELNQVLDRSIGLFVVFNVFWIYYLIFGSFTNGSVGKKILKIKVVNNEGKLGMVDLLKRYRIPIILGVSFTFLTIFVNPNTILNLYFPVMAIYIIGCNADGDVAIYDRISNLKITKSEQDVSL